MIHHILRFFNIFKYTVFVILAVVFSTIISKSTSKDDLVGTVFADTPYIYYYGEGGSGEGSGGSGCGEGGSGSCGK